MGGTCASNTGCCSQNEEKFNKTGDIDLNAILTERKNEMNPFQDGHLEILSHQYNN